MKRPMLCCGCAALIISILAVRLETKALSAVIVILLLSSAFIIFFKHLRFYVPLLLLLSLITCCALHSINDVNYASSLTGEIEVSGVICEIKGYDKSVAYIIKTDTVNGKKAIFKLHLVSTYGLQYKAGDRICAVVDLFDDSTTIYERSNGIYRAGFLSKTLLHSSETNYYSVLSGVRDYVSDKLFYSISFDEASLLTALTLGDKSYITDSLGDNVRRAGVSHVIVVSGLHLGIVTGAFQSFSRRLRLGSKLTGATGLIFIFIICAVTGFTVSALRAGLAFIIIFTGYLINRRPDSLNSLFCAATIIILLNPFVAANLSFQLSFSATFGIIVISPRITNRLTSKMGEGRIDRLFCSLIGICVTTVCATILTLPFTVFNFGTVSLVSIATNMIITYAVTAALILTVMAIMLCGISGVYDLILLLAGLFSRFIIFTVNSLGNLPFAEITFENKLAPTVIFAVLAVSLSVYSLYKFDSEDINSGGNN